MSCISQSLLLSHSLESSFAFLLFLFISSHSTINIQAPTPAPTVALAAAPASGGGSNSATIGAISAIFILLAAAGVGYMWYQRQLLNRCCHRLDFIRVIDILYSLPVVS